MVDLALESMSRRYIGIYIYKRPSVARALLKTLLSLSHSLTHLLSHSNASCDISRMSYIMCHMSQDTFKIYIFFLYI